MNTDDSLAVILQYAGVRDGELDERSAQQLLSALGLDPVSQDALVHELARLADPEGEAASRGEFDFRVGNWRLDLTSHTIRASVMSAALAGVLIETHAQEVAPAILLAIIPSLLEIERVTLSPGDERLLFEVRRVPKVTNQRNSVDDLYQNLPSDIRSMVNPFDFADFIERIRRAGLAEGDRGSIRVRVRDEGERVPRVQWR